MGLEIRSFRPNYHKNAACLSVWSQLSESSTILLLKGVTMPERTNPDEHSKKESKTIQQPAPTPEQEPKQTIASPNAVKPSTAEGTMPPPTTSEAQSPSPFSTAARILKFVRANWLLLATLFSLIGTSGTFLLSFYIKLSALEFRLASMDERFSLQRTNLDWQIGTLKSDTGELTKAGNEQIKELRKIKEETQNAVNSFQTSLTLFSNNFNTQKSEWEHKLNSGLEERPTSNQLAAVIQSIIAGFRSNDSNATHIDIVKEQIQSLETRYSQMKEKESGLSADLNTQIKAMHDFSELINNNQQIASTLNKIASDPKTATEALKSVGQVGLLSYVFLK